MFARIGRWCFRNPWRVVVAWIGLLVAVAGSSATLGAGFDAGFTLPDSDASSGFDILDESFGGFGSGLPGTLVWEAEQGVNDPEVQTAITAFIDDVRAQTGPGGDFQDLVIISPYERPEDAARLISSQGPKAGQVAYAELSLPIDLDQVAASELGVHLHESAEEALGDIDGLRVEVGGQAYGEFEPPESELLGLAFAVVVLIVAMGSVVAMGTTIAVALAGVGIGASIIVVTSNFITMPDFAITIGLMIGLGVGIDYALFIVTRYREALHQGFEPEDAAAVALDTAGRSVIFAGVTVVVSLLGLFIIGLDFVRGLGIGAATTVAVVMAASITLLPAALGFVKDRVEVTRRRGVVAAGLVAVGLFGLGLGIVPFLIGFPLAVLVIVVSLFPFASALLEKLPPRRVKPIRETIWYRWSRSIQARPWAFALGATAFLLLLTAPILDLRLGFSDEGNYPEETTTRQAYDLIAEGFGDGANGPLIIATDISSPADIATLQGLSDALNATEGVAFASPAIPNDPSAPNAVLIQVQATSAPQDEATDELVHTLRDEVIPGAVAGTELTPFLTGGAAANLDITEFLAGRILLFFGVVLVLSFVLLMAVFRSIMVPLKAVIMNMLSIGAAYGMMVAIFQWGWLGSVFGIEGAPIEPFIPMMMFAVVFGLSMDYEVFLLSRVKEEYERTGDPVNSVADGLAVTARVITAAAAIMVVVFGSFVFEDNRIIKLFGLGLASAVFIDATVVRMLLVPSTMQLLGARNWWLPAWLDRMLPNLNVEGSHHEPPSTLEADFAGESVLDWALHESDALPVAARADILDWAADIADEPDETLSATP